MVAGGSPGVTGWRPTQLVTKKVFSVQREVREVFQRQKCTMAGMDGRGRDHGWANGLKVVQAVQACCCRCRLGCGQWSA